jgi:hypothetical protein
VNLIPVRVPAGLRPVLASERRMTIPPGHPLAGSGCPACGHALGDDPRSAWARQPDGSPVVLVFAGIAPGDRKETGWTAGAAVAVHEQCAGVQGG